MKMSDMGGFDNSTEDGNNCTFSTEVDSEETHNDNYVGGM